MAWLDWLGPPSPSDLPLCRHSAVEKLVVGIVHESFVITSTSVQSWDDTEKLLLVGASRGLSHTTVEIVAPSAVCDALIGVSAGQRVGFYLATDLDNTQGKIVDSTAPCFPVFKRTSTSTFA